MEHLGIDVHKRESQICILAEGCELMERRIPHPATARRRGAERAAARGHPPRVLDRE